MCYSTAGEDLATPTIDRPVIRCPEDGAELLTGLLSGLDREHCMAVFLNTKHMVLETATISVGSADHTFMGPREVYRDALLRGATALVLAHNHPSGDPEPSADDRSITRRLAQAGTTLGVELLDHLVVGDVDCWVSMARRGVV